MKRVYKFLRYLVTDCTHVQSVDSRMFADVWITVKQTGLQCFASDVRRYGWSTAFYNLRWMWRDSAQ